MIVSLLLVRFIAASFIRDGTAPPYVTAIKRRQGDSRNQCARPLFTVAHVCSCTRASARDSPPFEANLWVSELARSLPRGTTSKKGGLQCRNRTSEMSSTDC